MSRSEYDDYKPCYPHLLPSNQVEAKNRLAKVQSLDAEGLTTLDDSTFLLGWWALHWLHPALHPDDAEEWEDEAVAWRPLAAEAFRRLEMGEIGDSQYYAAEAVHNRVWREMHKQ